MVSIKLFNIYSKLKTYQSTNAIIFFFGWINKMKGYYIILRRYKNLKLKSDITLLFLKIHFVILFFIIMDNIRIKIMRWWKC